MTSNDLENWAMDARLVEDATQRFLKGLATPSDASRSLPGLVVASREQALYRLARRLTRTQGKRVRPLLALWMARSFSGASPALAHSNAYVFPESILRIAVCVEVLHAASLVVDDIEDASAERRGEPALHVEEGMPLSLNAASWCYFAAVEHLGCPILEAIATRTLRECHEGQALDLAHASPGLARALMSASHTERIAYYDATARFKTGALMEFVSRACGHVLGLPDELVGVVAEGFLSYGRAFQILDDVKNFVPSLSGAKTYEDLSQGLRNRVCLHLVDTLGESDRARAVAAIEKGTFRRFVLRNKALQHALLVTLEEGEVLRGQAARMLASVLPGSDSLNMLEHVLDRPLTLLRSALVDRVGTLPFSVPAAPSSKAGAMRYLGYRGVRAIPGPA